MDLYLVALCEDYQTLSDALTYGAYTPAELAVLNKQRHKVHALLSAHTGLAADADMEAFVTNVRREAQEQAYRRSVGML